MEKNSSKTEFDVDCNYFLKLNQTELGHNIITNVFIN